MVRHEMCAGKGQFRARIGESMDKRYQVFVSSTFRDLIEERREVMQSLLEMDCIPAGMELFPAANLAGLETYQASNR